MELAKSGYYLFTGVIKRLYWLAPTLLADPFDIAERWFGVMYEAPWWLVWVLVGIGIFIATLITYHDLRLENIKLEQSPKTNIKLQPRKFIDYNLLDNIKTEVRRVHGHHDDAGILHDAEEGWDYNAIPMRICSRCFKPRNKKGAW
ncbi:MAG: hypothetical protein M0R49_09350 [Limnochordia bacterium]|nr:hypothetical protein [Limnochordia bacterium]